MKKKLLKKLPSPSPTGLCSVCGEKAFHRFSNGGWSGKDFCVKHLEEGEAYWREINEID